MVRLGGIGERDNKDKRERGGETGRIDQFILLIPEREFMLNLTPGDNLIDGKTDIDTGKTGSGQQ